MKPVVGLDVDGTISQYHRHFIEFAEQWLGKEIRGEYDGSVKMHQWCGVSRQRYRQIKLGYRQSGLKRAMLVHAGASELSAGLRKEGARVVICTTRPYLSLSNIEPDLREWLRRNRIQYDDIILGEHKYRELARGYGAENIVGVLDDLPEMVQQAEFLGLQPILRSQPHNLHFAWSPSVDGLEEARLMLSERIANRRAVGARGKVRARP